MRTLLDLRATLRALRAAPWFTAVAVTTLSLGLAANVVIFSVLNAIRRPELPYREPARLLVIREAFLPNRWTDVPTSLASVLDLRRDTTSFSEIAAYAQRRVSIADDGLPPARVQAAVVTANLWRTLGVAPVAGRAFSADDDRPGAAPAAMIGYRLWRDRYGLAADVLQRVIVVDGIQRRICGVMPRGFRFPESEDVWLPLGSLIDAEPRAMEQRDARAWTIVGRLKERATDAQAREELEHIGARNAEASPASNRGWTLTAVRTTDEAAAATGGFFGALQAGAILLLLIMCGNLANLLIARGERRHRELAVRVSIGASRMQLVRLLMTEAVVLSLASAAIALVLAGWAIGSLPGAIPEAIPFFIRFRIDGAVVAGTAALTTLMALAAGLGSALRTPHAQPLVALTSDSLAVVGGRARGRLQAILLGAQTTMAAALLASTLVVSFGLARFHRLDLGFDPTNTLTFDVPLPVAAYPEQSASNAFVMRAVERLGTIGGVRVAAATAVLPVAAPPGLAGDSIEVESARGRTATFATPENYHAVTPGYFEAAGIRVLKGRAFSAADAVGSTAVAIVNAECARRYFGATDPIGGSIRLGRSSADRRWRVVIAVVANTIVQPLDPEIDPRIYVPYEQDPGRALAFTLRTVAAPESVAPRISQAIREVDPRVAMEPPMSGEARLRVALWPVRFFNRFAAGLAVLGLVVAAAGTWGLTQYVTLGRKREMAVRAALGAEPSRIARLIVRQTGLPVAAGVTAGLAASLAISNVLQHVLPGIPPVDPLALSAAAVAVTAVAATAIGVPAARATRWRVAEGLRQE